MSQEKENKITVEKPKQKDPRKVEMGKRLAKISKEAKEIKIKIKMRELENQKEILDYIDFKYVVGGVTILGGIFGLYFAFKRDKREIRDEKFEEKQEMEKEENVLVSSEKENRKCHLDYL